MKRIRSWIFPALTLCVLLFMGGWFLGQRSVGGLRLSYAREPQVRTVQSSEAPQAERVELNRATREELMSLPGIGPALADRILDYRQSSGPFQYPSDLMYVSGIGTRTYEALKDLVYVEESHENTDH